MSDFKHLKHPAADFIDGQWIEPDSNSDTITSINPSDGSSIVWQGRCSVDHVRPAVAAARQAFPAWTRLNRSDREKYLRSYQDVVRSNVDRIADLIADETGKTIAESRFEAGALAAKVDITLDPDGAASRVRDFSVKVNDTRRGDNRFKPHGVMAVVGPFNFPAHLPNGHYIPALAAGNTIVFKPSDKTPGVGQVLAELWEEVGLPRGVFNLVQGTAPVASALVDHEDLNGILFTGSWSVGRRILEANLNRPGRIIALEMGGNNPAVIMDDAHLEQALIECVRAGFATTGQRCTCTRRVIVHESIADRFIHAFVEAARRLTYGPPRSEPPVFMGPVINESSVRAVLEFQSRLHQRGGRVLLEARQGDEGGFFVSPGVVEVSQGAFRAGDDEHDCEVFGPLVQVSRCVNLEDGIRQANATRYGLAASIFTASEQSAQQFFNRVNAGCINHNTGTAGASSQLAFGGLGMSGNHRPAGAFSVDYCSYPVASMVESSDSAAVPAGMIFNDAWLK